MKHVLYALLTAVSIYSLVADPLLIPTTHRCPMCLNQQPQPQPEVTQKVVIGYLALDDWEFENLFPTIEWKYLTHINASFAKGKKQTAHSTSNLSGRELKVYVKRLTSIMSRF